MFEAKRELAATQLSLAVNGDTSMGLDINEMLVHLVSKGLFVLVPSFRQAILEWIAYRPSKTPSGYNDERNHLEKRQPHP